MAGQPESLSYQRYHIVLIPGFGGFDALGQVEYYAGITDLFQDWKADKPVVLHYFDNFPTAAVVTRAERLRSYLAKRIVRGEILKDDEVTLVGHSTGGLDIRRLVFDLHNPSLSMSVDGGHNNVSLQTLRQCVRRVVFLSVPHWGTNIADWVHAHPMWREAVVTSMRTAVAGSQVYLIDQIEQGFAGAAAGLIGTEILLAVQDALTESNDHYGDRSPQRTAAAHEAASELALYVRHMASDFHVINDLMSQPPDLESKSPAHFNPAEREQELERWNDPDRPIECLSYVTVGSRPFRFDPDGPAPVWNLADLCSYPEFQKDKELSDGTDFAYRLCYRACAGGPFRNPQADLSGKITQRLNGSPPDKIALWDNDGIVNTASMPWPRGVNVLVDCDHLDIVGHYRLVEAYPTEGRQYRSYDALRSTPPFSDTIFRDIWTEIFKFCVGESVYSQGIPAADSTAGRPYGRPGDTG